MASAEGRHFGLVADPVAQQAVAGAGPAPAAGPGHRAPAGGRLRRAGRELSPRRARRLGPRAAGTAGAEPAPGDAAHQRLRPDRPLPRSPGFWRGRRSHERPAPPERRTGQGAGARGRLDWRHAGLAARRDWCVIGFARAPALGPGPGDRRGAVRGGVQLHGEPAARVQRVRRSARACGQRATGHRPEQRLPLRRWCLRAGRRQWRQHFQTLDARHLPARSGRGPGPGAQHRAGGARG